MTQFGKVKIIFGDNGGRFPFCNSIFIDDLLKAVIDPGAGLKSLQEIRTNNKIDIIYNTHYHFDHIAYNYLFDESKLYVNEQESICYQDRRVIPHLLGMVDIYGEGYVDEWIKGISNPETTQSPFSPQKRHEWLLSTSKPVEVYHWGDIFDFGTTKMKVIGTPGHSAGFNCLYFPEERLVYTGDYDLTKFGPWYFGKDCDIDLFVQSANRLLELDADTYVTGHEVGILNKEDFTKALQKFLSIIDIRDEKLLATISRPMGLKEIANMGIFYGKKCMIDEWLRGWEEIMVYYHLQRLIKNKALAENEGLYYRLI